MLLRISAALRASEETGRSRRAAAKRAGGMGAVGSLEDIAFQI